MKPTKTLFQIEITTALIILNQVKITKMISNHDVK